MFDEAALRQLEADIGYTFNDPRLLKLALTHRSWIEERHPGGAAPAHLSQQRLEFLGDAVLGYVVGRWLYERLPTATEKELTSRRKGFACGAWLAALGARLNLRPLLLLGEGEAANVEKNLKVMEDTVEALIGAITLDSSEAEASQFLRRFLPEELPTQIEGDPVVLVGERYQARHKTALPQPEYSSEGAAHLKVWIATYTLHGESVEGRGASKQDAKRDACRALLKPGNLHLLD